MKDMFSEMEELIKKKKNLEDALNKLNTFASNYSRVPSSDKEIKFKWIETMYGNPNNNNIVIPEYLHKKIAENCIRIITDELKEIENKIYLCSQSIQQLLTKPDQPGK